MESKKPNSIENTINVEETFKKFFPQGSIEEISFDTIPSEVLEFFEGMSARFVSPDNYKSDNFEIAYLIKHDNGDLTYVAEQEKDYQEKGIEKNAYFFDVRDGKKIGHGELRYSANRKEEFFDQKPFVGFTNTEDDYRRLGLGERRLFEMGAYSQIRYGLPLYSSTTITKEAEKVWQKLEAHGKANKIEDQDGVRYKLVLP